VQEYFRIGEGNHVPCLPQDLAGECPSCGESNVRLETLNGQDDRYICKACDRAVKFKHIADKYPAVYLEYESEEDEEDSEEEEGEEGYGVQN